MATILITGCSTGFGLETAMGDMDPQEQIDRMIATVPADTGKFRNVCPQAVEDMLKEAQAAAWTAEI
jgi:hypothetical protein